MGSLLGQTREGGQIVRADTGGWAAYWGRQERVGSLLGQTGEGGQIVRADTGGWAAYWGR